MSGQTIIYISAFQILFNVHKFNFEDYGIFHPYIVITIQALDIVCIRLGLLIVLLIE